MARITMDEWIARAQASYEAGEPLLPAEELVLAGIRYREAKALVEKRRGELHEIIRQAVTHADISEVAAAEMAGVTRMTVRRVLGK